MALDSRINLSNFDEHFPKVNVANQSSQGFRDNFRSIKDNFLTVHKELSNLNNTQVIVDGHVVGKSSQLGMDGNLNIKLTLKDTGVKAGVYENFKATINRYGQITKVEQTPGSYIRAAGDAMIGDLTMKSGNIILQEGQTVAGRDLIKDGKIIDAISLNRGVVVSSEDGVVTRSILGKKDSGIKTFYSDGQFGDILIGVQDFTIAVDGDVRGNIKISGFVDQTAILKLTGNANLLSTDGGKLNGPLSMNQNFIRYVKDPTYGDMVGSRNYNDARYIREPKIDMSGFIIKTSVGNEAQTRILRGENGISIINEDGIKNDPIIKANNFKIKLTGDVSGENTVWGLNDTSIQVELKNHYTKFQAEQNFLSSKNGGKVNGDVIFNGHVTLNGLFHGRNVSTDGSIIDSINGNQGIVVSLDDNDFIHRNIIGDKNQIIVLNGSGIDGNIEIGLCDDPIIPGFRGITIPSGLTEERAVYPNNGTIRLNLTTKKLEYYLDEWFDIPSTFDFATGAINIGDGSKIYEGRHLDKLRFKTIKGSGLISINEYADNIIITTGAENNVGKNIDTNNKNSAGVFGYKEANVLLFKPIVGGNNIIVKDNPTEIVIDIPNNKFIDLGSNSTIFWDVLLGQTGRIYLRSDHCLYKPTNMVIGERYTLIIYQNDEKSGILTFDNSFRICDGFKLGNVSIVEFIYDGDYIYGFMKGVYI